MLTHTPSVALHGSTDVRHQYNIMIEILLTFV